MGVTEGGTVLSFSFSLAVLASNGRIRSHASMALCPTGGSGWGTANDKTVMRTPAQILRSWLSWASRKTWVEDPLGPSRVSACCQSPTTVGSHVILVLCTLNILPTVTQGHCMIVVLCTSVPKYFCVINVMCSYHMRCDSSPFASTGWGFHACLGHNFNCGAMGLKQPVLVPEADSVHHAVHS